MVEANPISESLPVGLLLTDTIALTMAVRGEDGGAEEVRAFWMILVFEVLADAMVLDIMADDGVEDGVDEKRDGEADDKNDTDMLLSLS